MYIKKVNPNTHQDCRSLLQKAVRRGNDALVSTVVNHLYDIGDIMWLKKRVGVIIAEECWPLMGEWELPKKEAQQKAMKDVLNHAALSIKFKDAAGLGSLAYALSEGDNSVLTGSDEDFYIQDISDAIKNDKKYWERVIDRCSNDVEARLVERAEKAYRKGGWPWDKAFIQAAAYLAVTDGVPQLHTIPDGEAKFPFWVALDKHTPQGKATLRKVAQATGLPWRQLNWVSFYCESGRVTKKNEPSRWWDREVEWRLGKVGLSYDEAKSMWAKAQPVFIELLQDESERLEQHLNDSGANNIPDSEQLNFLGSLERTSS